MRKSIQPVKMSQSCRQPLKDHQFQTIKGEYYLGHRQMSLLLFEFDSDQS